VNNARRWFGVAGIGFFAVSALLLSSVR